MSRIGKVPIAIPDGVQVTLSGEGAVGIKGPKGELTVDTSGNINIAQANGALNLLARSEEKQDQAYHGLYHRLLTNAIHGVTKGYSRELELQGVGYRADLKGPSLELNVGRSHKEYYKAPTGVTVTSPDPTRVIVEGIDKQAVNQAAASIRAVCPPEPYKGKGIRYKGEHVRRKVGKTGA